jgi:hypothetical protein
LYIRPYLSVSSSDEKATRIVIRKRSAGRDEIDAMKKTGGLQYNYSIKGDTLLIDEYFTIPPGRKWSADNIAINLYVATGTVLKLDKDSRILFHHRYHHGSEEYFESRWESGNSSWVMTDDGLLEATRNPSRHK